MEAAASRGIYRAGNIAFQDDPVRSVPLSHLGDRRQKCLRIGVLGIIKDVFLCADLYDLA